MAGFAFPPSIDVFVIEPQFGSPPQPAFLYVPVRGESKLEVCPPGAHEVCLHLSLPF